ncbi:MULTISPECIES: hypothetical protein [unclassified Streptococcus]|uniref:hypothetical protein n=2 Tax=Streptococcus TaxID=1301 RepID=UPI0010724257|nr:MULTISPECIES: hypothetical protein [unclassified Streptococcus]MBF0787075.1 hypothetical protein [Streptococcus sp. 19428wC2_LYSM12]MCQ9211367.1 hypothetical protein [Streptococcus sp. B01]MCQ9214679.1 hypothetical protein [Streptococcus sp. O1]TFV05963.1 hypothetical protein E4T79_04075 [Streptococcus sp. LYSM12]
MYFSVNIFLSNDKNYKNDFRMIQEYVNRYFSSLYFKIKQFPTVHLLISGIFGLEEAEMILSGIKKNFCNVISGCSISDDGMYLLFKDEEIYKKIRKWEIAFDEVFMNHYFLDSVDDVDIIVLLKEWYANYEQEVVINSHISHFWGFFASLNINQKIYIKRLFQNRFFNTILRESVLSNIDIKLLEDDIELLLSSHSNFNFFYPTLFSEIKSTINFSSEAHKRTIDTISKSSEFLRDKIRITNRWGLNILYEKLPLLGLRLLDKYYINYYFSLTSNEVDIDRSMQLFIDTGEERLL